MARVTVEDCITVVPNRFELVLLAAQRARDIAAGSHLSVERDNDKNAVVALREIAEQCINFDELRRHIARGVNRYDDLSVEDDTLLALTQEANPFGMDFNGSEITEMEFEEDGSAAAGEEGDDMEPEGDDFSLAAADDDITPDMAEDIDIAADLDADERSA